jgi:hypothetical protein
MGRGSDLLPPRRSFSDSFISYFILALHVDWDGDMSTRCGQRRDQDWVGLAETSCGHRVVNVGPRPG